MGQSIGLKSLAVENPEGDNHWGGAQGKAWLWKTPRGITTGAEIWQGKPGCGKPPRGITTGAEAACGAWLWNTPRGIPTGARNGPFSGPEKGAPLGNKFGDF